MLTRWNEEELATLHRMMEQGKARDEIAKELGCDTGRVRKKIWDMSRTPEQRRNCAARRREQLENGPDEALLAEARRRADAPHRDLAGAFFNDPRKGFSALDRRGA